LVKPDDHLFKIAPSLLSADFSRLAEEIAAVEAAGADWLHVDVMDGHFVPNLTIGPPVIASLKKVAKVPLDVHLMINSPEYLMADFVKAGADILTIHVESTKDPGELIKNIRKLGVLPGITLRPQTPLKSIEPYLALVDLVLVMTVSPGFGGQTFLVDQVAKIDELAMLRKKNGYQYVIEVDGGINPETARVCARADVLVAGSYIFKNNYKTAIQLLRQAKV